MLPLQYQGEGQFTAPRGFKALCDKDLVIGETLRWEICHERSAKSHAHYFAVIGDAWANLPEGLAMDSRVRNTCASTPSSRLVTAP